MSPAQLKLYRREWAAARQAGRLEESDRHQIHLQVLGRDKSSKDLTNPELDKLLAAFRAISHPGDLNLQLSTLNQNRNRILYWIQHHCDAPYARALARDKFGTEDFQSLPFEQLQQLHMTLKNRHAVVG